MNTQFMGGRETSVFLPHLILQKSLENTKIILIVAGLCIVYLAGGWIIFMIGKKKGMTFKDLKK